VVQILLRAGASANATGLAGIGALLAAVKMNHVETAAVLVRARADLRVNDANGDSLLMIAVNENFADILTLLLESGMNPRQPDANGLTPLYWARLLKRPILEKKLLAYGADPDMVRVAVRNSLPYVFEEN
jgi:ankyrin repeat protein